MVYYGSRVMPHQIIENIGQDRTFRNIVAVSTGLALASMFASLASLKIERETGLSFRWHWGILPWTMAGAAAAWYFWRLVWAAQSIPSPENKKRLTRFSFVLIAMGAGAFLYPIRYVFAGYRNEISTGLIKAVIFLAVGAWVAYKLARAFDDPDPAPNAEGDPAMAPPLEKTHSK